MYLKLLLSTLICLIPQACNASALIALECPQHIVVSNNTKDWSLSVIYSYDEILLGATVIPDGEVLLKYPLKMSSIQIMPSGKYLIKTQFRTPENLIKRIEELKTDPEHFMLTIASQEGVLESFLPFQFAITELTQKEFYVKIAIPESRCPIDAFPNATDAIEKNKFPFPRHYLELSLQNPLLEKSFMECLDEAYKRLHAQWQWVRDDSPEYVAEVHQTLASAYGLLKIQKELSEIPRIKKHLPELVSLKSSTYTLAKKTSMDSFQCVNTNIGIAPLSLKEVVADSSDTSLEKAYKELKSDWEKILADDEDLSVRVQNYLYSEYEFVKNWKNLKDPVKEKKDEEVLCKIFSSTGDKSNQKSLPKTPNESLDFLLKEGVGPQEKEK